MALTRCLLFLLLGVDTCGASDNDCIYDSHGILYTGGKSITDNNTQCVDWSSVARGIIFEDGDEPKNFCRNPLVYKRGRLNKLWCYVSAKKDIGICDVKLCGCPANLYDQGCVKQCHCKLPGDVCDHNGVCNSGCADGWTGIQCQTPCEESKYGHFCQLVCDTCLNKDCDHETGQCLHGCVAGYTGDSCQTACNGSYGMNCRSPCGKCKGNTVCDRETGHCKLGCYPGYRSSSSYPRRCDIPCSKKYFGVNCLQKCSTNCTDKLCEATIGTCLSCIPGKQGSLCDEALPAQGREDSFYVAVIVGLVIAFVVLETMIVIGVLIWRRLRNKMNEPGKTTPHIYHNYSEVDVVRTLEMNAVTTKPDEAVTVQDNSPDHLYDIPSNSAAQTQKARRQKSEDHVRNANNTMATTNGSCDETNTYVDIDDL